MSSEVVGKKLSELRVYDLKTELEKRGLETTGIKIALLERLQKVGRLIKAAASQPNDSILFFFFLSFFVASYSNSLVDSSRNCIGNFSVDIF